MTDKVPVRVISAHGQPPPTTSIERRCERCGAGFLGLAVGKTGKRGLWSDDGRWWCSVECAPDKVLGINPQMRVDKS